MPRMYFRHPVTGAMIPLTLGGSSGGNEVTVSSTQPTDGTDLWMDLVVNKLKYRDPANGTYVNVPDDVGASQVNGNIQAGNGLTGGGYQSTSPALHVGAGSGISVAADSVAVNKGTLDTWYAPIQSQTPVDITNWNSAVNNNVVYRANNAANAPDTGWYFGICFSHDSSYKHQILYPYANGRWASNQMVEREMEGGVWGDWNRAGQYYWSRDTLDGFTFSQHNGSGSNMGVRRFAWGMYKDKNTNNASASDQWRVQCYDTGGSYTWNGIVVAESGAVSFPKGHSLVRSRMDAQEPLRADEAATVGMVVELVIRLMQRAGIEINPAEVVTLMEETQ